MPHSLPLAKETFLTLVDWHQQNVPSTAFTCEHLLRLVPSPRHHQADLFCLLPHTQQFTKNPLGLNLGLASSVVSRPYQFMSPHARVLPIGFLCTFPTLDECCRFTTTTTLYNLQGSEKDVLSTHVPCSRSTFESCIEMLHSQETSPGTSSSFYWPVRQHPLSFCRFRDPLHTI